jgi:hypothetical protein
LFFNLSVFGTLSLRLTFQQKNHKQFLFQAEQTDNGMQVDDEESILLMSKRCSEVFLSAVRDPFVLKRMEDEKGNV